MRLIILTFIGLMLLLPITASHAVSPVKAGINECMLFLGLSWEKPYITTDSKEPFLIDFKEVIQAAKNLRAEVNKGIDPHKDHLPGLAALASKINTAIEQVAEKYASDEVAVKLTRIRNETGARMQEGRLTYAYMLELPLLINSAFVGQLDADRLSYKHDDQIERALKHFPRQLHLPVMQGQLIRSERDQLLDLGVWPIETGRRKSNIGGIDVDPYARSIHQVSLANHLSHLGQPKFWMGLMPYLMDGIQRAELDNRLKNGILQPIHEKMFSTYAGYLYELQRSCPTVECLVIHLTQTGALDMMIEQVVREMGDSVIQMPKSWRANQEPTARQKRKAKNLGKIYLQTFKKVLLRYAEDTWAEEKDQNK